QHGEKKKESKVNAANQFALAREFHIALLAFLNLPGGLGKPGGKRHSHNDLAIAGRGRAYDIVGLAPLEVRMLSAQGLPERKASFHFWPGRGSIQRGCCVAAGQGQKKPALQGREVLVQFVVDGGKTSFREGRLKFLRLGDGLRLRRGVLTGIVVEQSRNRGRVGPHLLDRL